MIEFIFNNEKAKELILFFASQKKGATKLEILKYLFFSDLYHLNKYGRPILGGDYKAMKLGPVSSQLYNMMKEDNDDFVIVNQVIKPHRAVNLEYFSASDIEAMEYAYKTYCKYSGRQLSDISHEHKSWENARKREPWSNNPQMNFEEFFDEGHEETIEFLNQNSILMAI